MDKISFDAGLTKYDVKSIQPTSTNVLRIIYANEKPDESVYGLDIMLFTSDDILEGVLIGWTTIYKIDDEAVYLSNDGSVYTEPEPQTEPGPSQPDDTEPEVYEPTVEEVQSYKISQMESTCQRTITAGVDVALSDDTTEHFSLTTDDQLALLVRSLAIDHGADEVDYHADGEPSKYYSADDMQEIINTAEDFIDYHTTYCNELCLWIKALTDKDEIESVYYGMDIPAEHRSEVLEKMLPVGDDETGMLPQEGKDDDGDDDDGNDNDSNDNTSGSFGDDSSVDAANTDDDPADDPEPGNDGEDD